MSNQEFDDYEDYLKGYIANASQVAILLDYDGTLAPAIVGPEPSILPPQTKEVLEKLSRVSSIFLAVISGRAADTVKQLVGINNVTYSGNHGFEVIYPDNSRYVHQLPTNYENDVEQLMEKLELKVNKDGTHLARIDNKGASITFHTKAIPEDLRKYIEETAQKHMEESTTLKIEEAFHGFEIRPIIDWHKGDAALLILEKNFGNDWRKNVKVIFAGDDRSDEDAMLALKGYAATFRISASADLKTHAEKRLSSLKEVLNILKIVEKKYLDI